jgi:hypothetical protein
MVFKIISSVLTFDKYSSSSVTGYFPSKFHRYSATGLSSISVPLLSFCSLAAVTSMAPFMLLSNGVFVYKPLSLRVSVTCFVLLFIQVLFFLAKENLIGAEQVLYTSFFFTLILR